MPIGFKGHRRAQNKDHLQALSHLRHGPRLQALRRFTPPPKWDSRTLGIVGGVKDQSQCGSCWRFSGIGVVEIAFNLAKVGGGPDKMILSEEYGLDCSQGGGCNGDDNTTVLQQSKAHGDPLSSDYGPYTAGSGRTSACHWKSSMPLFKVDDWGFADSSGSHGENVTSTADIKAAIMQYGCVGCAVAAGGDSFWNSGQGTGTGRSSNIDHDVIILGWDDDHDNGDGTKGAWIMRNSWGEKWGSGCGIQGSGCGWVKYGAYNLGTEAVWAVVHNPNPLPPPNPWGP